MGGPGGVRVADALVADADLERAATAAAGQVRGALVTAPDLAVVFVAVDGDPDAAERALRGARAVLGAGVTIGCDARGVIGAGRGVETEPAVAVWGAVLPGTTLRPFHLEAVRLDDTLRVAGVPVRRPDDRVAVLLADPWSFPADGFLAGSDEALDGLPFVGGLASGAERPGGGRLLVDDVVHDHGAVGVVVGGDVAAYTVVSQGCRPIGPPMTVTAAAGADLVTLAGRSALERAREVVESLPLEEQALAVRGLWLGVARDEHVLTDRTGDYLVRGIVGADPSTGAVTVGDVVPVGSTVRFHLRDADAADDDLRVLLDAFRERAGGVAVPGVLLFSCNGRGRAMFPDADHDVAAVRAALGAPAVAGFFAAGEIGPVGGRSHVHSFTASLLAFGAAGDTAATTVEVDRPAEEPGSDAVDDLLRDLLGE